MLIFVTRLNFRRSRSADIYYGQSKLRWYRCVFSCDRNEPTLEAARNVAERLLQTHQVQHLIIILLLCYLHMRLCLCLLRYNVMLNNYALHTIQLKEELVKKKIRIIKWS